MNSLEAESFNRKGLTGESSGRTGLLRVGAVLGQLIERREGLCLGFMVFEDRLSCVSGSYANLLCHLCQYLQHQLACIGCHHLKNSFLIRVM